MPADAAPAGRRAGGDDAVDVAHDVEERVRPSLPGARRAGARSARATGAEQRRILRQHRVRPRRGGRSTARSAAPAASAATPRRPFTSNHSPFLWPAHTCPTETRALGAAVEPHEDRRQVFAGDRDRLARVVAAASRTPRSTAAGFSRVSITVVEIGEHLDDPPAGDVLHQVAPVRSDVADRRARAALVRLEAPREVGRLEQPVLQVGAVDEVHRAELAAGDHLARLLHQRVAAIVERHGVDDARLAAPRRAAGARRRRSSPAACPRRRASRCASAARITGTCR